MSMKIAFRTIFLCSVAGLKDSSELKSMPCTIISFACWLALFCSIHFAMNGRQNRCQATLTASHTYHTHTLLILLSSSSSSSSLLCCYIILLSIRLAFDWMAIFAAFHFPILFLFFSCALIFFRPCSSSILDSPMNSRVIATFVSFYFNAELSISPERRSRTSSMSMRWLPNNKHWLNENGLRLCSYYVLFILIVMSIVFYCWTLFTIVEVRWRGSLFRFFHVHCFAQHL